MADDGEFWARQRVSFGAMAATYDAARPEWPAGTASWLCGGEDGAPQPGRALRVADVGAGTGKLTRSLLGLGHDVVAVEPSEGMLEVLRGAAPGAEVRQGPAEELPLPDASVDAVTAAQAWHWFDEPAASAECARVLRPGGVLGVGWHVKDTSVPWVDELMHGLVPPVNAHSTGAPAFGAAFGPVQEAVFRYEQALDADGLVAQVSSWSYVALAEDRDAILERVRALHGRVAGPDGLVVVPHETRCYRAVRTGRG